MARESSDADNSERASKNSLKNGACSPGSASKYFQIHTDTYTVSGQNTIGIYSTPLVLIQPTDVEQNAVNNNWLFKLQPAVKLQSWQKSNFHQIE